MTVPTGCPAIDLMDPNMIQQGLPLEEFARLRRTAPITWYPTDFHAMGFDDDGYWVVTRHADVTEMSKSKAFSTFENGAIARWSPDMVRERIEIQRLIMLNQDPPEHTTTRRIVARGFTPRAIAALKDALADRAQRIVAGALASGSGNFVNDVAAELPLQAICELIGVPQEDRHKIFEWSNLLTSEDANEDTTISDQASAELMGYSWSMAESRKSCPMDDLTTKLMNAQIDGEALDETEFAFFVMLLAVAGNETTRNAISHGMNAFFDNPEQWEIYKQQRPATAADEIVRISSPIIAFQRTALEDTTLGGVEIKKGQRLVMFYSSANQDETVFENPEQFNVLRDPNPHLGFGGSGTHYCLGANLARLEIDLIFNAIADHMPNIRRLEPATRLRSAWINGLKDLPVAYS
jgi:cholest-4-en-3-one 26-monooxygenase